MKTEDPRVTDYALGELREEAREEFEKDLSQSDDLQRELEATGLICQKLSALPHEEKGFDERTREELREECLRNVRIVRREQKFRRAALIGALGALAACLLLAPFIPWTALLFQPNSREARQGAGDLLVAVQRADSSPAPANSAATGSKLLASVESMPDPTSGLPKAQDPGLVMAQPQVRLESRAVASSPTATLPPPVARPVEAASAASQANSQFEDILREGIWDGLRRWFSHGRRTAQIRVE